MRVPAVLWWATGGVVGGELASAWCFPSVGVLALTALSGAVLWRSRARPAAVLCFSCAVGLARMRSVAAPVSAADHVARLPLPFRTTLVARVVEAPQVRESRTVLVVDAEEVRRGGRLTSASGLVRLSIHGRAPEWRYGDRLRVDTILRAPRGFANPGSFDLPAYLARRGIRVTAGARDPRVVERLERAPGGMRDRAEAWRARLAARIAGAVSEPEAAVLRALVLGDDGGIPAPLRDAFARAGVVHVLSVSGLHVGLVAAAALWFVGWLLGRSERLLLATDVGRIAAATALGPVLVYAVLAGAAVATLRSTFMVITAVAATLLERRVDVLRTLALAALLLALAEPGSPLEIGYQLSFVSVVAIVAGTRRFAPAPRAGAGRAGRFAVRLATAALVSPCALLGTAPLTAFHFHQVSLAGVVANPLVVPLFGGVVVGAGLVGAFVEPVSAVLADCLFALAGCALRPGIRLVEALGRPAWAAVDVPIPNLWELVLLYGLLGSVLLPRGRRGLAVAAFSLGVALDVGWWVHVRTRSGPLRATFLDVGQGDAAVVELPGGRVLVVDAGGFPGIDFDTGAAVVGPFLWSRKILRIDVLAMTHAHPDHSGGLPYLLAHFQPREFWWSGVAGHGVEWDRLQAALAAGAMQVRTLSTADVVGAEAVVLHPPPDWTEPSLNDSSLTLRVAPGVLLTGDVEARAERALITAPGRLRSAVLKVPHHGSRTSSAREFLEAVDPQVAVISVGADNPYRLPNPEVEAAYRRRGACVLRTDRCGAVSVELPDDGPPRTWTARPGCRCVRRLR